MSSPRPLSNAGGAVQRGQPAPASVPARFVWLETARSVFGKRKREPAANASGTPRGSERSQPVRAAQALAMIGVSAGGRTLAMTCMAPGPPPIGCPPDGPSMPRGGRRHRRRLVKDAWSSSTSQSGFPCELRREIYAVCPSPLLSPPLAPKYVRIPNVFTSALNTRLDTRGAGAPTHPWASVRSRTRGARGGGPVSGAAAAGWQVPAEPTMPRLNAQVLGFLAV